MMEFKEIIDRRRKMIRCEEYNRREWNCCWFACPWFIEGKCEKIYKKLRCLTQS